MVAQLTSATPAGTNGGSSHSSGDSFRRVPLLRLSSRPRRLGRARRRAHHGDTESQSNFGFVASRRPSSRIATIENQLCAFVPLWCALLCALRHLRGLYRPPRRIFLSSYIRSSATW